mmetsp:Transcript_28478/g.32688  ORF Transcript_28478/g.32688 Transcript_28478/m.32688 type:complete len:594 (-) Transcript_28478:288-2069(-)
MSSTASDQQEATSIPFLLPTVSTTPKTWGPPSETSSTKFHLFPYAPFGRSDRLGRAADFSQNNFSQNNNSSSQHQNQRRDRRFDHHGGQANTEFQYKVQADDFELVDSTKATSTSGSKNYASSNMKRMQQNRLRQLNARRTDDSGGASSNYQNQFQKTRRGGAAGRGPGGRGGRGRGRGRGGRGFYRERIDRQASVAVKTTWTMVQEMDLNKVSKGIVNNSKPLKQEDLLWCGFLDKYNEVYDKCSTKNPATLKRSENKEFYYATTMDDPNLEKFAIEQKGTVFATDAILAHLMTCPRSAYPWDIVVQKIPGGQLFFDKRDSSQFDYLTVNETSNVPPSPNKSDDDPEGINTPERLSVEATMCNQNFSQQILKTSTERKHFDLPNPFYDEEDNDGMEPASVAYRYRKFDLGDDVKIVCRTELHGIVKKGVTSASNEEQYMTAFALNEYFDSLNPYSKTNIPSAGMINWREKLDSQRGAVFATELKNNAFKLAKWTAQSILAGADQMKIGFVSRAVPKTNYEHQILATQFYRPRDFATQVSLNEGSMWGFMRMLIGLFKDQPEGKYVLMRDPNKATLKVYAVPSDTFEDEDEEE